MVVVTIALGYDNIGSSARPVVVMVSLSVPVPPVAAVAVVSVAVVVLVVAVAAAVVAVVLDLSIELEAGSVKAKTHVSLWERPGTVQRPVSDSVVDRRRPTSMETGMNGAMDTTWLDETDCCSAATSPAGRIGDMAVTVLMPSSLEVRGVFDEVRRDSETCIVQQ